MKKFFLKIAGTNGADVFFYLFSVMLIVFIILWVSFYMDSEIPLGATLGLFFGSIIGIPLLITWGFSLIRRAYITHINDFKNIEHENRILLKVGEKDNVVASSDRFWGKYEHDGIYIMYLPERGIDGKFSTSTWIHYIKNVTISVRIDLTVKAFRFNHQELYDKLIKNGNYNSVRIWIASEFAREAMNSAAVKELFKNATKKSLIDFMDELTHALSSVRYNALENTTIKVNAVLMEVRQ